MWDPLRSDEFKCCPVTTHDQRWVGGLFLLLHEQEKRNIYGKRFRIAVGGKNPGGAADPRPDDLVEPLFFGQFPSTVYEELIHRFYAKSVIDITPGQGTFGEMCIKHRVGYFCVAFTEAHAQFLHKKFQASALKYMADESSAVFLPKCAEAMGKKADKKPEEKKRTKPSGKREPPGADPSGEPTGKKDPPAAKAGAKKAKQTVKTEPGAEGGGIGSDNGGENGGNSESSWDLSDDD